MFKGKTKVQDRDRIIGIERTKVNVGFWFFLFST